MAGELMLNGPQLGAPSAGGGLMLDHLDGEQRIVENFRALFDESRQLFNGLRDLPQIGHKGWQSHFEAAFNAYTKLWRFQQQFRNVLDSKYDLKRWQIGEIASKIGQLYYHYYLRTSDCNHLIEANNFYEAIRSRGYFNFLNKDIRSSLVIKKLRYYTRYIVVCLLLKRMKLVNDLIYEFSQSLETYSHVYEPEAQLEWSLVLQEIRSFIEAESLVAVVGGPGHPDGMGVTLTLSKRLSITNVPKPLKMPLGKLYLAEALIVGNYQRQVKFSELTIDMYRILQILEREPTETGATNAQGSSMYQQANYLRQISSSPHHLQQHQQQHGMHQPPYGVTQLGAPMAANSASKAFNLLTRPTFNSHQPGAKGSPHKYLLFRPTFPQLHLFLSSGFMEMPSNGVLLIYVSADGIFGHMHADTDDAGYDLGGVALHSLPTGNAGAAGGGSSGGAGSSMINGRHPAFKQQHCLHPGDLQAFIRKPMVLILDSNNSYAFQHMPRHFGLPLLVLMSPTEYPAPFNDNTRGSLFTMFLYCPLTALCSISNIIELPETIWRDAQSHMDKFYTELGELILHSRLLDPSFIMLCADDFLRLLIFRFIFCFIVMRWHRLFRSSSYYPRSYPQIPELELLQHPVLKQTISELTIMLDIRSLFD